jgi:hypothetical protein
MDMNAGLITPINDLKQIAVDIVKQVTSGKDYWNDGTVRAGIISESGKIDGLQTNLLAWMNDGNNCSRDTNLENSKKVLETIKSLEAYIIFYMFNVPLFTRLSAALTQMNENITNLDNGTNAVTRLFVEAIPIYTEYHDAEFAYGIAANVKDGAKLKKIMLNKKKPLDDILEEMKNRLDNLKSSDPTYDTYWDSIKRGTLNTGNGIINDDVTKGELKGMLVLEMEPPFKTSEEMNEMNNFLLFMSKCLRGKLENKIKKSTYKTLDNFISYVDGKLGLNKTIIDKLFLSFDANTVMANAYKTGLANIKEPHPDFSNSFPFKYNKIMEIVDVKFDYFFDVKLSLDFVNDQLKETITNENDYYTNILIVWSQAFALHLFLSITTNTIILKGGRGTKNNRRITNYTRKNLL